MPKGRPGKVKWTAGHDEMIRELYPTWGAKRLAEKLGVDHDALMNRAFYLGVKFHKDFHWTEQSLQILRERYVADGPKKIADELGTTRWAVTAKARRLGLGSTRKLPPQELEWDHQTLDTIRQRYVEEGPDKLAEELGVTRGTIYRKAGEMGLHTIAGHAVAGRRRAESSTSCDIHYFDELTPNGAWILGFLFADGNVHKHHYYVQITLARRDEHVLNFIRKELKSENAIYRTDHRKNPTTGKCDLFTSTLSVGSTVMVESLLKLGLNPRKTYRDDPFPDMIPDKMLPHFIRGFFDGDGSAALYHYRGFAACSVSFIGTSRFITGLRDILVRLAGMRCAPVRKKAGKTVDHMTTVAWGAVDDVTAFHKFVYPPGEYFSLQRKKDILDKWLAMPHRGSRRPVKWTHEEEEQVRNLYHELGLTKLAELLDRDRATVITKVKQLGLQPINDCRKWSDKENQTLRDNYQSLGAKGMEALLDRPWWNIRKQAERLGLIPHKTRTTHSHTGER